MLTRIVIAICLVSLLGCSASRARKPSGQGNALPLTSIEKYDASPSPGFVIPVTFQLGDKKVTKNLVLDTGSSGIYVLASELSDLGLAGSGPAMKMSYAGGQYLSGYSQPVTVAFGDAFSAVMPIGIATAVGCRPEVPNCPFSKGSANLLKHGYAGLIGTSPRASGGFRLDNPLVQIQDYSGNYLVSGCDKRFVLDPSPEEQQGFQFISLSKNPANFANGRPSWLDLIPVSYSIAGIPVGAAPRMSSVDTGVTGLLLSGSDIEADWLAGSFLKPGLAVQASAPNVFSWSLVSATYTVHASQSPLLGIHSSILGAPFVLSYDVIFDLSQGRIGIRKNENCTGN